MNRIHPRMPVILHARDYDRWLDKEEMERLPLDLLRLYESKEMEIYEANPKVGNIRNNGPEMMRAAARAAARDSLAATGADGTDAEGNRCYPELWESGHPLARDEGSDCELRYTGSGEDAALPGGCRQPLCVRAHQHLQPGSVLLERCFGSLCGHDERHWRSGRTGGPPGRTALARRVPLCKVWRDDYGAAAGNSLPTGFVERAGPRAERTSLEDGGQAERHARARYCSHPERRPEGRRLETAGGVSVAAMDYTVG